jgi:hypothetical protein
MPTIREFLTHGRLGDLQLGLRPEQVARILGDPDDRSVRPRPITLLRFGAAELAFKNIPGTSDSRLVSISLSFDRADRDIPMVLRPTDWLPTGETTEQEFQRFLETSGIPPHSRIAGDQECLILLSGASAAFRDGKLHSIHLRGGEKKNERKQMTVSLPEETVARLKQRAKEERVSVHDLIERMIKASA